VVEHPEPLPKRIIRFADVVGRRERDRQHRLRLAQEQFNRRVHPSIMWAKLEAMAEGAQIAARNCGLGGNIQSGTEAGVS